MYECMGIFVPSLNFVMLHLIWCGVGWSNFVFSSRKLKIVMDCVKLWRLLLTKPWLITWALYVHSEDGHFQYIRSLLNNQLAPLKNVLCLCLQHCYYQWINVFRACLLFLLKWEISMWWIGSTTWNWTWFLVAPHEKCHWIHATRKSRQWCNVTIPIYVNRAHLPYIH